ncbi:MAG: short-chain fatty acid transporter [Bacteroidetes bacterium]|nr:MAG: short-chain fatty acid transporter [Bacteroidota bacterium]
MDLIRAFEKGIRKLFPSTFTIAIFLTILTFLLALFLTDNPKAPENHLLQLVGFWYQGLWNPGMLAFAVQMMLILVLGYVLASTSVAQKLIDSILVYCTSTAKAALLVTLITLLVSFFNWGLGLIFGAIFARKVAEYAGKKNMQLNYPLIAAAGYSGLMVWHGGISGSAPLKVAEQGHFLSLVGKDLPSIDMGQTIFSSMNISIAVALLVILPVVMYFMGRRHPGPVQPVLRETRSEEPVFTPGISGVEKIDYSQIAGMGLGLVFLLIATYKAIRTGNVSVIDPDFLNFVLLGLSLLFCGTIARFLYRVRDAMGAASGILIQFPLYFGIMGIMKYSGLVEILSNSMMAVSTVTSFPVFTFLSAAVVNIFIPSGGGQWVVQGPIIVEAAQNLGVPLSKSIMALAYGDEITNMIQPFWALPLLGITGLKAKDIIPYTLLLMLIGGVIFIAGLLIY